MKNLFLVLSAILVSISSSFATIAGFAYYINPGNGPYTVPASKILVLQQFSAPVGTPAATCYLLITPPGSTAAMTVQFASATNGLYTLPKALLLPAGTVISGPGSDYPSIYGVVIDPTDAPLFVGGGSTLGTVAVAANTMTGVLQLPKSAAGYTVLFQSSTNLINWAYDNTVTLLPGTDKTKLEFMVPVSGMMRYYRALTRCANAG
jgi:hypothetical protein